MNKGFPPNIDPQIFSLYAVILGVICVDDYSTMELNSIGNWVILFGQYILTTAAQQQLIESRIDRRNININSRQAKNGGNVYGERGKSNQFYRDEVEYLLEMVERLRVELENYKKNQQ